MSCPGKCLIAAAVMALFAAPLQAQGYQLRLDSRVQGVSYRGVRLDSVPTAQAVTSGTGGLQTTDGYAVVCPPVGAFCLFYRPGERMRGGPLTTTADLTMWGLGIRGVSLRMNSRLGVDLGASDVWPGSDPALQLIEGYFQYASSTVDGRAGRMIVTSRLNYSGFDGASLTLRDRSGRIQLSGYGGLGLSQGTSLPINSEVLNPLDDYQLSRRQIVAGGSAGWTQELFDLRFDYQRQVDRRSHYFVAERAALSGTLRPFRRWSLTGGAEYDLANGWWGTSDLSLRYTRPVVAVTAGWRRYRPQFDLWTIWGAFSPVAYQAVSGTASLFPLKRLQLRARGERYWYDDTGANTPLVVEENRGWRFGMGATFTTVNRWTLDLGYQAEFGVGASSRGWDGALTYVPNDRLNLTLHGTEQSRPLEFRFDDAQLKSLGIDAEFRPGERVRFGLTATRYFENHKRPDASAFDWNQTRIGARITLLFRSGGNQLPLPPAVPRRSGGPAAQ